MKAADGNHNDYAITVPVKWTAGSYTVTLHTDGGIISPTTGWASTVSDIWTGTHTYNSLTILPEISKTGYTFDGWYKNSEKTGSKLSDNIIPATTNDITEYWAKFNPNSYTVVFDKNSNEASGTMDNQTFTYDTSQALKTNTFTRAGYKFAGWSTSADGSVAYSDGCTVQNLTSTANGTVNLYAVWDEKVTLSSNNVSYYFTVENNSPTYDKKTKSADVSAKNDTGVGTISDIWYVEQGDTTNTHVDPVNAGTYDIYVSVKEGDEVQAADQIKVGELTISPKGITNDKIIVNRPVKTYDGTSSANPTFSFLDGVICDEDDVKVVLDGSVNYCIIDTETETSNVSGSSGHYIKGYYKLSGKDASNYTLVNNLGDKVDRLSFTTTGSINKCDITRSDDWTNSDAWKIVTNSGTFKEPVVYGIAVNGVKETVSGTYSNYYIKPDGSSNWTSYSSKTDLENALKVLSKGSEGQIKYTFTPAENSNYKGNVTCIFKYEMIDIEFFNGSKGTAITASNVPLTIASGTLTYGLSWEKIITSPIKKSTGEFNYVDGLVAYVGDEQITGTFSLNVSPSVVPDAGEATYKILFTDNNDSHVYEDITVYEGKVTIEKKNVSISDFKYIAPTKLTYDGSSITPTISVETNGIGNPTYSYYDESGNWLGSSVEPVNAGTYSVKVSGDATTNYNSYSDILLGTYTITPKVVTIGTLTVKDKVYDGTTKATLSDNWTYTIDGLIEADKLEVSVDDSNSMLNFEDVNAGENKTVTAEGYALKGDKAGNYTLDDNQPSVNNASISKKDVTISQLIVKDKEYDGTTTATISDDWVYAIDGLIDEDKSEVSVDDSNSKLNFEDKDAGNNKTVTASGYALTGKHSSNYNLSTPTVANASITPATITVKPDGNQYKLVGSDDPELTYSYSGNVDGEKPIFTGVLSREEGNSVGEYTIKMGSLALSNSTEGGNDYKYSNYTLAFDSNVVKFRIVQIQFFKGTDKTGTEITNATSDSWLITLADKEGGFIYGDTWDDIIVTPDTTEGSFDNITGIVAYEGETKLDGTFSLSVEPSDTPDAGTATYSILFTDDKESHQYNEYVVYTGSVTINPKSVTKSDFKVNVPEDCTYKAQAIEPTVTEDTSGVGEPTVTYYKDGTKVDNPTDAGTYTIKVSGDANGNYAAYTDIELGTFTIDQKSLTIKGTAVNTSKVYDGNTVAVISSDGWLEGKCGSDDVNIDNSDAKATYESASAATGIKVSFSGYSLSGNKASNYKLSGQPESVTADITKREVTITGLTAANKVYDGTTGATINGASTAVINNIVSGDSSDVSIGFGVATFNDKNVGTGKAVEASGFTLKGVKAGNYSLPAQPELGTADITQATIVITAPDYSIKKGASLPTLTIDDATITGLASTDTFSDVLTGSLTVTFYTDDTKATVLSDSSSTGSYVITYSGYELNTSSDVYGNYAGVEYKDGTLTINKKKVVVDDDEDTTDDPGDTEDPTEDPTDDPTDDPSDNPDDQDDPVTPVVFKDVKSTDWYYDYVTVLAQKGIINGMGDGRFEPEANITRAQFVKILAMICGIDIDRYTGSSFSDVSANDWFAPYVAWAKWSGVSVGSDGKFMPNDNITRQDMAVMIERFAEEVMKQNLGSSKTKTDFTDNSKIASYAVSAVSKMEESGIINGMGDGTFAPTANATRAQTCAMIYKYLSHFGLL